MNNTIYYFGNETVKEDRMPYGLIKSLQKHFPFILFIHLDPTENIPIPKNKELVIIDTVMRIDKVTVINNLDHFILSPRNSVHDFDLPLELTILKKLRKVEKVTIIGLPPKSRNPKTLKDVIKIINSIQ